VKASLLVLIVVFGAACGAPPSPPAVQEQRGAAEADRDVLRAAILYLTNSLRAQERSAVQRLRQAPLVLVFDETIRPCDDAVRPAASAPPGCFTSDAIDALLLKQWRERAPVASDAIRAGERQSNVEYVSSNDVVTIEQLAAVVRRRPAGTAVVALSAPVYPSPRSAVVYFRRMWEGFGLIHLEYRETGWTVTAVSDWRTM
jgi:hypothetical protein